MESTVKARPNHYEILGLKPTASGDDIARAFTREISVARPRAFGGLAELSIAYETLRDPARRRSYDESLGLKREPEPGQSGPAPKEFKPFMVRASARPAERPPSHAIRASLPEPEAQPKQERPVDPRVVSIAASLRELARPAKVDFVPDASTQSETQRREPEPEFGVEPLIQEILAVGRTEKQKLHEAECDPADWKKAGLALGGVVFTVGILAAVAGWSAGLVEEPKQAEAALTIPVPAPEAASPEVAAPALPEQQSLEAARDRPRHRRLAEPRIQHSAPPERLAALAQELEAPQSADVPVEQAAADPAPVAATPAKMPLSNATIARTIGRIGYPCGGVASVESESAGAFKVTCSSGHSYRAAPVRGRYHFRRLGSQ